MPSPASTERPPGLLRRVRHELQRRDVRARRYVAGEPLQPMIRVT